MHGFSHREAYMDGARWRRAGMRVEVLTGEDAIAGAIPDVAALRIAVFRDFPYLYDGDADYEQAYLADFAVAAGAVVVVARAGARVVGAATGVPLAAAEPEWAAPFEARGLPVDTRFYCAESVLLPEWRGLGVGHAFFDAREAHARRLGLSHSCFCSVIRPGNHPARPDAYRPNDAFWLKRGYRPLDGVTARFSWRDIGDAEETRKMLQFWERTLS